MSKLQEISFETDNIRLQDESKTVDNHHCLRHLPQLEMKYIYYKYYTLDFSQTPHIIFRYEILHSGQISQQIDK